jgi:hypothetical protein
VESKVALLLRAAEAASLSLHSSIAVRFTLQFLRPSLHAALS